MSRMIDADALLYQLDKRRTYEVMDGRNKAYGKGVRDAMKDIDAATTIDAIQVEWLKEHDDKDIRDSAGNSYGRRRITVVEALSMWQREQEAR